MDNLHVPITVTNTLFENGFYLKNQECVSESVSEWLNKLVRIVSEKMSEQVTTVNEEVSE